VLDPWREAVADAGGTIDDKRVGIIRGVFVTDEPDREWTDIAAAERYRRDVYVDIIKSSKDHADAAKERSEGARREPIPLNPLVWTMGDVDHCVGELTALIVDHGVTDLVTWGGPPGLPPSVMNASLERFANEVIPRVRANVAGR
jgi:hypothetical protein